MIGNTYFGRIDVLVVYTAEISSSEASAVEDGSGVWEVIEYMVNVTVGSLDELDAFFEKACLEPSIHQSQHSFYSHIILATVYDSHSPPSIKISQACTQQNHT